MNFDTCCQHECCAVNMMLLSNVRTEWRNVYSHEPAGWKVEWRYVSQFVCQVNLTTASAAKG